MEPKYFETLYSADTRQTELSKIVSFVREGSSCQLVGLPGVGRSTLFGVLVHNREVRLKHFPKHHDIVHFVLVNFSEVKKRPFSDVVKFLFLCLGTSLRERAMQEEYEYIDGLFKKALAYNDELVLSQDLKNAIDYLAIEKKLTIIFLFDRFDEYVPQVSDELFTLLRSLRDRAKYRFSVIFSLARPLEMTIEPQLMHDFSDFISGHVIYLSLFDAPSVEFRISYLEKLTGKKITQEQRKEILRLTGGHLRLVKVCVEAIMAEPEPIGQLEEFFQSKSTVQAALKSIWQGLTPEEQADLVDRQFATNEYLRHVGLVTETGLAIPLFAQALEQGLFKENEAKLVYDETSNVIKKGETVISDGLTKAEFRLLRYLLQHPGEVVERETIIHIVWQEDKTTEGVTEQAVDQLLFRLRHKIEAEPTQPKHLQTIKGRGVKYTP